MARGDYVLTSAEWEAVERWENEGGRFTQSHDYMFYPIGKDHLWQADQAMPIGSLGKRDWDFAREVVRCF